MKLQMPSNVREIRNWACKQPEMTNLFAHPFPLYPTPPTPSYHWVPVERKDVRVSSVRVPVIAYSDECTSTKWMTSTAIYTSWVFRIQGTDYDMNRERERERVCVCVRKSPLARSKIPGGGGGGATWINFCGVLRTPTPLLSILWQIIRLASHAGVFRGATKYEGT